MSESIYQLIPRVMADIGGVAKTRRNEQQKYSFRGIEDFYLAAHPALIAHGVFCAPKVTKREQYRFEKTNEFGKVTSWLHVAIEVEHIFYAPNGSSVTVTTWGEGLDNSDKATNKAMSGAMKYALIELFCVPTQDVEDSDRTSPETGVQRSRPNVPVTTEETVIEKPKSTAGNSTQAANQKGAASAVDKSPSNNVTSGVPVTASREKGGSATSVRPPDGQHQATPSTVAGDLRPADAKDIAKALIDAHSKPKELRDLQREAKANLSVKPAELPEGCVDIGQASNFAKLFREAMKPALRPQEQEIRRAWLKRQGIVDGDGEPTSKAILKASFYEVREAGIEYAASLEVWP